MTKVVYFSDIEDTTQWVIAISFSLVIVLFFWNLSLQGQIDKKMEGSYFYDIQHIKDYLSNHNNVGLYCEKISSGPPGFTNDSPGQYFCLKGAIPHE